LPRAIWREGELDEKPPQHRAHQRMHAETDHESRIDLRQADDAAIDHMRRHYYAKITTVDEQVGKVLDALAARGYLEDSLVILCSDHGELLGDHRLAYKWLLYDPIVHIPLMIKMPGGQGANTNVHDLVSLIDLGPTLLDAIGADLPDYLEGKSLLPYLQGETTTPRQAVYSEDNYQIMLRTSTHKLIYYIGQEAGDLYDLAQDPHELWNRWDDPAYTAVQAQLLHDLMAWFTTSVYYNAGYTRERACHSKLRWPDADDARLHGPNMRPKQVGWL
jgi:arylsulfatase A-like enzyme